MAGRKNKNTVEYFPHYVNSAKTMFIIESKFGHLGYAVWFKTLELLGSSENHFIDLRNDTDLLFLISKLNITEQQFNDIYNLLAKLDAIDKDFWENKIIFSSNFIENISDAYIRRSNKCMNKYDLCLHLNNKCKHKLNFCIHKSTEKSRVKKSRVKERKEISINNFYIEQLELSNNDKTYKKFVDILYGVNSFKEPLINVLSVKEQLTFEQFNKILAVKKENNNENTFTFVLENLEKEANKDGKPYIKGKKTLYLTILKWFK